jgi:3-phosphoshikimate 1-carboxyvinyltransferase
MDALTTPATCLRASPSRGLKGMTAVPGDKSMSHRALILAGLAEGTSRIEGLLDSEDVQRTVAAVQALGCDVANESGTWSVTGGPWETPESIVDCGNSGTAARLLMGAIAGRDVIATLSGDASLRTRPMARVIDPLVAMGAHIDRQYYLPVTIRGGGLKGIRYQTPVPSAQVKSAILLAGLGTSEPVEVEERQATRDHTERMLEEFGCDIDVARRGAGCRVRLGRNRTLKACDLQPGAQAPAYPLRRGSHPGPHLSRHILR